jgi:hypothetical protein
MMAKASHWSWFMMSSTAWAGKRLKAEVYFGDMKDMVMKLSITRRVETFQQNDIHLVLISVNTYTPRTIAWSGDCTDQPIVVGVDVARPKSAIWLRAKKSRPDPHSGVGIEPSQGIKRVVT